MKLARAVALAAGVVAVFATNAASGPSNHIASFAALFNESPLDGGQVPPRQYKWVNHDVTIFVQFDRPNAADATSVRYIGMGIKGTFCAEAEPGGAGATGGFTHYHRATAPTYAMGHAGQPGENKGYWLLWAATESFDLGPRKVTLGVDYQFSPTPPPNCGANVPQPSFTGPNEHDLTRLEIKRLIRFFNDDPFRGGQTPPRFYRWLNADTLAFLEFDNPSPAKAKAVRYFGLATRGIFCADQRRSADFTSFHRRTATSWAKGQGGKARQAGFWHLALALDKFTMPWGAVTPGVDRKFAVTRAPSCS